MVQFYEKIQNIALNKNSHITFIIGGTLGMSDELLEKANELI
ncbi:MAG: 23S rRNA (pseudouridine(1915)-N(3))-methyltransferase RlmH, partial [Clostridia bacterium]|nr:23S rRNA (pseudouridine(1915)-N(3))-methyltransferase RlmH [Clostridia bacterium]